MKKGRIDSGISRQFGDYSITEKSGGVVRTPFRSLSLLVHFFLDRSLDVLLDARTVFGITLPIKVVEDFLISLTLPIELDHDSLDVFLLIRIIVFVLFFDTQMHHAPFRGCTTTSIYYNSRLWSIGNPRKKFRKGVDNGIPIC